MRVDKKQPKLSDIGLHLDSGTFIKQNSVRASSIIYIFSPGEITFSFDETENRHHDKILSSILMPTTSCVKIDKTV